MGPTVAIWVRSEQGAPTPEELLRFARTLDSAADSTVELSIRSTAPIGGTTDDSGGRPFGFNLGDSGFDEEELKPIEAIVGFTPSDAIHVFAYANSEIDHRMLAELAVYFARTFQGVIDFGGNLGNVSTRTGKLLSVPYSTGSIQATFHVSDADFLEAWLRDPAFHMVK